MLMQRWGISFREIETEWTYDELFRLIKAAKANDEAAREGTRGTKKRETVETIEQRAARLNQQAKG